MRALPSVCFAAILALPLAASASPGLAETTEGPVQGVPFGATGVWAFRGIPFAAPPVGDLRFARPEPPAPRVGTLDASAFGPSCPQILIQTSASCVPGGVVGQKGGSEDCLTLNVYTPATTWPPEPTRPVMVFIHGGGLTTGCARNLYDSTAFADDGVVLVTIQYRLGVLGFFATGEIESEDPHGSAGNQGILDQVAALEWVRANAAAFGGDPSRVTVFGESAGGVSVCTLLASPTSDGLFERAIIESGGCPAVPLRTTPGTSVTETAIGSGESTSAALGCATPGDDRLSCLRATSVDAVLEVQRTISGSLGIGGFSPTIDGHVLLERPRVVFPLGAADGRDVVIGSNRDEMTILLGTATQQAAAANYEATVRTILGDLADPLLAIYPPPASPADNLQQFRTLTGELLFNCPTLDIAGALHEGGSTSRVYHFTQQPFSPIPFVQGLGVFHALELFYVFDRLPLLASIFITPGPGDVSLAATMQAAWASFAAQGDPSTTPAWPAFDPSQPERHYEFKAGLANPVTEVFRAGRCAQLGEVFTSIDPDHDLVFAEADNCSAAANSDQFDVDADALGDVCDACPQSDHSETVTIGDCDSGVANSALAGGCTLADEIARCVDETHRPRALRRCLLARTRELQCDGEISRRERRAIDACAREETSRPHRPHKHKKHAGRR